MSGIKVSPAKVSGAASPPPSKSAAHRALICAALAGGGSVRGVIDSDDMRATLGAVGSLGVRAAYDGCAVKMEKAAVPKVRPVIDCLESGSTLRFMIPVFAALGIECTFTGRGRLPQRPLGVYGDCLPKHGVNLINDTGGNAGLPLTISGRLEAGRYDLPGNVSSQFISGLLFALPLCEGTSEIVLNTPLESAAYIDMTIDALNCAGVMVHRTPDGWRIPGGQSYRPYDYEAEGDWSQAAFLLAMGALGGEITINGVDLRSRQGDIAALELMRRFGADISVSEDGILCRKSRLKGIDIDAAQIPDLVPVLAVAGALAEGVTTVRGASRLRLKESDRLAAVHHCLSLLGAKIGQTEDGLRIEGVGRLKGGVSLPSFRDHRIVMSMAVAALCCEKPVIIEDYESVNKSWPEFFGVYRKCGGEADVIQHR